MRPSATKSSTIAAIVSVACCADTACGARRTHAPQRSRASLIESASSSMHRSTSSHVAPTASCGASASRVRDDSQPTCASSSPRSTGTKSDESYELQRRTAASSAPTLPPRLLLDLALLAVAHHAVALGLVGSHITSTSFASASSGTASISRATSSSSAVGDGSSPFCYAGPPYAYVDA